MFLEISGIKREGSSTVEQQKNSWLKWKVCPASGTRLKETTQKMPEFSCYFQRNIQDNMMSSMLLPVCRKAGLLDEFSYNNVQERVKLRRRSWSRDLVTGLTQNACGVKQ